MSDHKATFNQSEAVTRCRGYKESKLRGQYALAKLVDEEVTIHSANLDEGRNQLMTQLSEQRAFDKRQEAEAEDFRLGRDRKTQFTALVDKLSALKLLLRFQEDNRESETAFKLSIRHKRAAFQVQLARLEKRQVAERNELFSAQARLAETAATIRSIEVLNMKDQKLARALKKKHAILDQQTQMKQQKESQFLREIQLCKTRQLQQLTELDITNSEEMQEILAAQRIEEFELIAKQKLLEAQNEANLDKQLAEAQALHMIERQKIVKIQLQRAQRKQKSELERAQKAAARVREKVMLAENPIILNSTTSGLSTGTDANDISNSETSRSQSVTNSQSGTQANDNSAVNEETTENEGEQSEDVEVSAKKNSEQNKAASHIVTDEEKEIAAMMELGRERNRATQNHHRNIVKELRVQHKTQINLKTRDQKRKVAELLKEQQEEMEQLKNEQDQTMAELIATQAASATVDDKDLVADMSSALSNVLLPEHIKSDISMGNNPTPLKFEAITVFAVEIVGFAETSSAIGAENTFKLIHSIDETINKVAPKFSDIFKVQFDKGLLLGAAGLSKDNEKGTAHLPGTTESVFQFLQALQSELAEVAVPGAAEGTVVEIKAGVHTGPVVGGLIGTSFVAYHLIGATVAQTRLVAASSEPGHIQVAETSKASLGANDEFEFEERGIVEADGVKVNCYWLK
jgi:class 3 adenylate cyclase